MVPLHEAVRPTGPSPSSTHPEGRVGPPQATRPPVTRLRSGLWELSQHELSAIPEAETSFGPSLLTGRRHHASVLN